MGRDWKRLYMRMWEVCREMVDKCKHHIQRWAKIIWKEHIEDLYLTGYAILWYKMLGIEVHDSFVGNRFY